MPRDLEWDDDNIGHLAQHSVSADEVEQCLDRRHVTMKHRDFPDRRIIFGRTDNGRYLKLIVQVTPKAIRPITGWTMSPGDRKKHGKGIPEE